MCDGLSIGSDPIMFLGVEIYKFGAKAGKNTLNQLEAGIRRPVFYQYLLAY